MKKLLSVITMILLLVVVLATTVNAAEIVANGTCGNNLTWTLDSAGVLTISGTGYMEHYYSSYEDCPWETRCDEITKVVVEEGVTTIGTYAFNFCAITEVSLPSTLTNIYEGAFYYCENLTHIDIPESVKGTADKWFAGCKSLKMVKMPAGIEYMPGTFKNCSALESVYIPANAGIGYGCFDGCNSLTDVQFDPNANYCYENGAIYNKDKTKLELVMDWYTGVYTVPQTVQTIASYAFANRDLLTEICLPEGLQKIEAGAFENCTALEKITIPSGVQTIGNHAFEGCTALREIEISYGVQEIAFNAFKGCTALQTIEIPDSVQTIGQAAFKNCSSLKNVMLPAGLEIIEDELFYGCKSLRRIVFPENVRYFGESVFGEVYNLERVFFFGDAPAIKNNYYLFSWEGYKPVTVYHLENTKGWPTDTWSGATLDTWEYTLSGTASCTQPGSLIYTDAEHGLVYTRYTTEAMHLWSEPALGKYPTTKEDGYWIQTCTRCGKQEKSSVIPKFIETEQKPILRENDNTQTYTSRSEVVRSYLEPTADGGYLCIFNWTEKTMNPLEEGKPFFTVESYDQNFQFQQSITMEPELPIFGGYYNDGQYRYVVVGQTNYGEDDNREVIRVIRYTQDWIRIDSASLYDANTQNPFFLGSLRMSHSGDMLYIRTSHTMYSRYSGAQANMTLTLHIPTMEFTSTEVRPGENPLGYQSYSYDQFIQTDGQDVIAVDYNPSHIGLVVLQRNSGTAGQYYNTGSCETVNIMEQYENARASVGGLEISDTTYLIAGNIITDTTGGNYQRNIFVTATSKDDFSEEGTTITYLTDYDRSAGLSVSTPHMVKIDEDTYAVMWTEREYSGDAPVLNFAYVDQYGQWDGVVYTTSGELSDCKPIVIDGRIVWYTSYSSWEGEEDEWAPEFYQIRLEDPPRITVSHRPLYWLSQVPTDEAPGILAIYCVNGCYRVTEMQMPALSEADYTCREISQTDCANPGKKIYTWKDTTYGTISWEEVSQAQGHSWKDATCTAPKTCSVCGATEGSTLSHNWQAATCLKPKTCSICGKTEGAAKGHSFKAGTCTVCGAASGGHTHTYTDNVDGTCNGCGVHRENVETRKVVHMFRMYNPNTGEHFYTGSTVERDNLIGHGWKYEGVGFTFPANTGAPVHRLFQPSTGEHLYTMDEAEKDRLMAEGWNYEGIAFNSAYDTEAVQHRLHNPNAKVGAYHFTFSAEEKQNLINAGWEYQGIGWYSCWK